MRDKNEADMERMLLVVFDTENKPCEGKKALFQLETEGSISVYASAVVTKNADGTATEGVLSDQRTNARLHY